MKLALFRLFGVKAETAAPPPLPAPRAKTGRPRANQRDNTLAATKPWEAAKVSRRTWFRRQAETRNQPATTAVVLLTKPMSAALDDKIDTIAAEGAAARRAGTPIEACPYRSQAFADTWRAGWHR